MRSRVIAAVVIVALVAAGVWGLQYRSKQAAAKNQTVFRQEKVKRGTITSTITGTGPVASVNGVMVRANQSGTVVQLLAQDGDKVKGGQVVMVLENDNLQATLKQAQIDVQNNQANLENLLNPQDTAVKAQMIKLDNARLTLKQRQTDVASLTLTAPVSGVISAVKTTVGSSLTANTAVFTIFDDSVPSFTVLLPQQSASQVSVGTKATVEIAGFGKLTAAVQQGGASATPTGGNKDANVPVSLILPAVPGLRAGMVGQATFAVSGLTYLLVGNGSVDNDSTEVRVQVAGTVDQMPVKEGDRVSAGDILLRLTNDNLLVSVKQAENDIATQEQALDVLLDPSKDPNGNLRTLRNKLEASQITLASRQSDFDDLRVKVPVDGQISSLTPRVGDRITTNQSLFRVADYGAMQITIVVDELDIAKSKIGQKAQITLDALPGRTYTGKVAKINPEGIFKNDIATFEVTVQVENPQGLMAGMNSTVNIVVQEKEGLYVPAQAVQIKQGKASVQIKEGENAVSKEVQVGLRTNTLVEITGGLKEGDEVITTIIRPSTAATGGMGGMFGGGNRPQGNQTTFPQGGGGGTPTPATGGTGQQPRR